MSALGVGTNLRAGSIVVRELFVSVVSGIIVALVLGLFKRGGDGEPPQKRTMRYDAPPRRGSPLGGLMRLSLAVAGGIAFAYSVAPMVLGRRFGHLGGYDRFDRFDRYDGYASLAGHMPVIILTVLGTVIVWVLLSALRRR